MQSKDPDYQNIKLHLGSQFQLFQEGLNSLKRMRIIGRIWERDHTVWKPDSTGISDRLGWLTGPEYSNNQLNRFEEFSEQIRREGFRHILLIGMGGSSLGAEVLNRTIIHKPGFPKFILLDSTVPDAVNEVLYSINLEHTLFIISSKSGGSIETNTLYLFFRGLLQQFFGKQSVGKNFIAITDPDSSLHEIAKEHQFRQIFLNPPDIGGRFSVLSAFGLLPATLTGIDIEKLVQRARTMQRICGQNVPVENNPAAILGSVIGSLALRGRDKLTLITSPSIKSFGSWVEQILAESTGKDGKGIIPVHDEPLTNPNHYGEDRLFVYLRLSGDQNKDLDTVVNEIVTYGHPTIQLDLDDEYDISGEFFLWQFATAVIGRFLGIQPFDQPNVQQSKDVTDGILQNYKSSGALLHSNESGNPKDLLDSPPQGTYLSIMAYIHQNRENEEAIQQIRRTMLEQYQIPTTFGYGPRFLHSTGQLHKGGPSSGRFLQIVSDYGSDLKIPERSYTFGILTAAQAEADYNALYSLGRPITRVRLGNNPLEGLQNLLAS